jgi:hypothetical protein
VAVRNSRFRIELFDHDANHGPGDQTALIDDFKDMGLSAYANDVGELYFTLPISHRDISAIRPLETHYRVSRFNDSAYDVMGVGVIEDFDQSPDEMVVYGHDYFGLLTTTITSSTQSYSAQLLGNIITDQLSQAINETNSRLGFTALGTIDTTSKTTTLITSYQPRLDFLRSVAEVSMGDSSVRSLLRIGREAPFEWDFVENYGQDRRKVRLEYGYNVSNFRYIPNFREFATRIRAIGIKQEGATLLFSDQGYASETTYGRITRARLFQNLVNQAALDDKTKREARLAGRADKLVQLEIRAARIAPYTTYEIGDSVPVIINRGRAALDSLYTIWGQEWTVDPQGRELLYLDLATKET